MTLLSITKMIFRYFKAVCLNEQTELFISNKYSVCLKAEHLTWSGIHSVVSKNKRVIQLCTNMVNLLLREYPWEKTVMSALTSVIPSPSGNNMLGLF